jgi:hypothetical protein
MKINQTLFWIFCWGHRNQASNTVINFCLQIWMKWTVELSHAECLEDGDIDADVDMEKLQWSKSPEFVCSLFDRRAFARFLLSNNWDDWNCSSSLFASLSKCNTFCCCCKSVASYAFNLNTIVKLMWVQGKWIIERWLHPNKHRKLLCLWNMHLTFFLVR